MEIVKQNSIIDDEKEIVIEEIDENTKSSELPPAPESSTSDKVSSLDQAVEKQVEPMTSTVQTPVPATRNKKSQKITKTATSQMPPFLIGTFNESKTNYSQIVKQK